MSHLLDDLTHYLQESPTAWHAVDSTCERLELVGFTPLEEGKAWKLKKGGRYLLKRGGSVCAFTIPKSAPERIRIIGAHTDSPGLKLKPNADIQSETFHQLGVEIYGGPLLSSWMNRDLGIAGRLVVENAQGKIEEKLVFLDEVPLVIPQIAIHLDREVNDKGLVIDKQDQLRPILTLNPTEKPQLEPLLKEYVNFKHLLAFDLFLVPLEAPRRLGMKDEMLASYRLDNLASSHACMAAIASAKMNSTIQMMFLWDAEEIGSQSAEGAGSTFAYDVLKRIQHFYKMDEEEWQCLKASSLCASVDVSHAYNPNYAKKYDSNHQSIPGKGIVIKYNASKKYVTDAKTAALVVSACKELKLPYQSFAGRSDMGSGSTIGPVFASQMGMPTVDMGIPLLSMHSIREVMAVQDHLDMCRLLTHMLEK
ncbi:MAG: M18 family aminopeptidase [Rhabdochlamydiaceae bacterium]